MIYLLAAHAGLTVNAQSAGILTVLVFGAGTDYALLLVARYREELRRHEDRHEAMARGAAPRRARRSSPAPPPSSLGMLCLLVAELNSTKGLGPVAAIGVAVGLLVMITLLPALLVICGRWVFWPVKPHVRLGRADRAGASGRGSARASPRGRGRSGSTTALVLGRRWRSASSSSNANGLTNAESFRGTPDSVVGEEVLAAHFPAGARRARSS